ncbi:DUF2383 domain-containing protein [Durusdinium trenchii]|uniref:DUF2383 domain-containing protein n=1 Tax=Durusdinium trenchii TaxID=1381693 RepID=A0ABP0IR01_9DINO
MATDIAIDLNKETIETLQELIQINIDSAKGFRHVAEECSSAPIAAAFEELALQRKKQADELAIHVAINDEQPHREGSYLAAVHRCWMTCRKLLSSNDLHSLLAEAERGEDAVLEAYEEACQQTLGRAIHSVLRGHRERVQQVHDDVRNLRDALAQ